MNWASKKCVIWLGVALLSQVAISVAAQETSAKRSTESQVTRTCTDAEGVPLPCPVEKKAPEQRQISRTCTDVEGVPLPCPGEKKPVEQSSATTTPSMVSVRALPKNLLGDQAWFWSSPLRLRDKDLKWGIPLAAITAYTIANDSYLTNKKLPSNPDTIKRAGDYSNYGAFAFAGLVGGGFVLGSLSHNDHMREASLLSGEAAIDSYAITEVFKFATGRQRPTEGNGKGEFWHTGQSFPSEHSAAAWSIAAVLAREYPSFWTQTLAYGGALGISAGRLIGQKHFASDVLIGSALGYYIGRETFNRHQDPNDKLYGTFQPAGAAEGGRNPADMGSPYVPIDSWVYPAFDRLIGFGFVQSAFLGQRPWARMECARLLEEAINLAGTDELGNDETDSILKALKAEFAPELARRNGAANRAIQLESVYGRVMNISGLALYDGYHFGQTVVNDWGRPDRQGTNVVTGLSGYALGGPFALYVRGEYQHAPSAAALPLNAQAVAAASDFLPSPTSTSPPPVINRLRVIEAYVTANLSNWQFSFGNQNLWWGPDQTGPMLFSNNAEAIPMLRISRISPYKLPSIFGLLGPVKTEYFIGQLRGHQFIFGNDVGLIGSYSTRVNPQPFIQGAKFGFKPTPNLEVNFSTTVLFAGQGVPFNTHTFIKALVGTQNGLAGSVNDPGDRRSALDFSYRLPKLRDWLTFYADGFADDQFSPIAYADRSAWTAGLFAPKIPYIPKLDLRVEGTYTDLPIGGNVSRGFFYLNVRFRDGYTNNGMLLGDWIGRQSQGAQVWSTYHFTARSSLTAGYRHQKISQQFISQGGTLTNASVRTDLQLRPDLELGGQLQYERWTFPIIASGQQSNWTSSVQFTYWPRHLGK